MITPELQAQLALQGVRLPVGSYVVKSALENPVALLSGVHGGGPDLVGAFTYSWSPLPDRVESVGRYCSIAGGVRFSEPEHPTDWISTSNFSYDPNFWRGWLSERNTTIPWRPLPVEKKRSRIVIGNDVWIGSHAYIKGGVSIGHGAIIGAHAVVTKDVPAYGIVAGNPARFIRYRFSTELVDRLLASEWWRYGLDFVGNAPIEDPSSFLDVLDKSNPEPYVGELIRVPS